MSDANKVGESESGGANIFVRKATEACKIVCSAIALEDGEIVCKTNSPNIENGLQPLLEAYRDAPSKDTKAQISDFRLKVFMQTGIPPRSLWKCTNCTNR